MTPGQTEHATTLLRVIDLRISFVSSRGAREVVHGFSFEVPRGGRVAIIGESGAGKSVTGLALLRLHDERAVRYGPESKIVLGGEELLSMNQRAVKAWRGGKVAMVFQDPLSSLSPTRRVGQQFADVIAAHQGRRRAAAHFAAAEALEAVHIDNVPRVLRSYPHEISGGMRQRVMLALALTCEPTLIVADEPTSALDVTVQLEILETLEELAERTGTALLIITHDIGVVARLCNYVYVMQDGSCIEEGEVSKVLMSPDHPYTKELIASVPEVKRHGALGQPLDGDRPRQEAITASLAVCSEVPLWSPRP